MDEEVQARLWADLADALASAQGGDLDGEAGKAIKQALMLQPDQPKALALAGSAAARHGKLDEAQKNWQALLRQLEPGSDMALRVQDDLLKLEALASEDSSTSTARTAAASKSRLSGELRWAASKANPSEPARLAKAQVFVVARADGHPGLWQCCACLRPPCRHISRWDRRTCSILQFRCRHSRSYVCRRGCRWTAKPCHRRYLQPVVLGASRLLELAAGIESGFLASVSGLQAARQTTCVIGTSGKALRRHVR
jgi:hypothetical protein